MPSWNVAVLGASGVVGKTMIQLLQERNFPIHILKLFSSKRSAGATIPFNDKNIVLEEIKEHSFDDIDFVLGAMDNNTTHQYLPWIMQSKAIFIDNSSLNRLNPFVPLIIPEINGDEILNHTMIANPNCATILALMAINPIRKLCNIQNMIVSTYQAVSGAGIHGIYELQRQIQETLKHEQPTIQTFQRIIAFNAIPQIGEIIENGFTSEEMKMEYEGQKILNEPLFQVNCTCVRVPIYRCHSASITLFLEKDIPLDTIVESWKKEHGIVVCEVYPTPYECSEMDDIFIGRHRKDIHDPKVVSFWCCTDQLRKGAALNAIQIMEKCVEKKEK